MAYEKRAAIFQGIPYARGKPAKGKDKRITLVVNVGVVIDVEKVKDLNNYYNYYNPYN